MIAKLKINKNILKWARENMHLTQQELAQKLHIKTEKIVNFETGEEFPTYHQLQNLAKYLYLNKSIFFLNKIPKMERIEISFRTLPKNEIEHFPYQLMKLLKIIKLKQNQLIELFDNKNPSKNLILKKIKMDGNNPINAIANQLRTFLGISIEEQINFKNIDEAFERWRITIEKYGIFIFKDAFKLDDVNGLSLYDDEFPIIYVNNSMSKSRQIFTLFHELAHLLFRTGGIDFEKDFFIHSLKNKTNKNIEIFCNQFAADFLIPSTQFNNEIQKNIFNNDDDIHNFIKTLSNKYKVSREVILRKLSQNNSYVKNHYTKFVDMIINETTESKKKSSRGDYHNNMINYLSYTYMANVFKKLNQHYISEFEASNYLKIKIDAIAKIEEKFYKKMMKG